MCRTLFVLSDNCSRKLKSLNTFGCSDWISLKLNVKNFSVISPLNAFSAISRILFSRRFSIFSTFVPWKTKSSKAASSVWVMWMFTRCSAIVKSPLSRCFSDDSWITRFWMCGNLAKKSFVKKSIDVMLSMRRLWMLSFDIDIACCPRTAVILEWRLSLFSSFTAQPYFRQTISFSNKHFSVIEVHEAIAISTMQAVPIEMLKRRNGKKCFEAEKIEQQKKSNLLHCRRAHQLSTRTCGMLMSRSYQSLRELWSMRSTFCSVNRQWIDYRH